jgi:hypothetical protein
MDTFSILTYICKKRDEFIAKGLNTQEALTKAERAVAEEYHIAIASINKLVAL